MIDLCTRYIVARAISNKTSTTVAQTIMNIFGDYGVALSVIQSDNKKEWSNTLMNHLTKSLKIQRRFSTPYYSQSNGSVENSIKTVTQTLRKMCGNHTRNWDD
jgi:transposase InsO family protein